MDITPDSPRRTGLDLYQQHLVETQYEREDVQKKTFGKWINSQLSKANAPLVTDLFYDLRDGTRLLALLSVLTGRTYKPERGCMRVHHLNNVSTAFRILDKHNVKLVNISSNDIVDGNPKLTLGLVWSVILHWQVQDVLKGNMAELQQSALDKTLLSWCQEATKDYPDVSITNFTTSWSDGLAFTALIHRFRPDLFDYELVNRKPANARLDYAFRAANKHLGIARLLDPEDVNTTTPDKKSIMMYVMCLYQALPHTKIPLVTESESRSNSAGSVKRSSNSKDPVDFSAYQTLMEEVLVWLLSAEDQLDSAQEIASDLPSLKEQFHKHEEFLLELTSQQGSVGAVLHEGTRIVKEGQLSNEEADEIHIQMRLLNSRWDQLRTKSMDRQARIHETLTKLQQQQLESLRNWLTETEDRISQLGAVAQPETLAAALKMLEDHRCLQRDLGAQQEYVNALSNMVVIVDESAGDNCSQMEDQLSALGERWSHVCQWAEQRAVALQQLADHWEHLDTNLKRLKNWLASHEHALRLIEANPSADRSQMIDVARQLQLLERDMEPHVERLSQLQDGTQRLPSLIQAVMVKEKTKRPAQPGSYRCVERILSDIEHLEDRIEALNEIMEAQRQRLDKSGVDLKMVILPPDITTTLSMFGSDDTIAPPRAHEESTSIKKRKLDPNRQAEFDDAIQVAKEHLEQMELCFDTESDIDALEKRHREQKPILDQVLNAGHALVDEMEEGAEEITDVEESMRSVTERWLLIEEMIKQRSVQQQEVDRVTKVKDHDNEILSILNMKIELSNQEQKNEHTLIFLKTSLKTGNETIAEFTPTEDAEWEELFLALDSFKAKVNQLETKISEYEKDLTMYTQLKHECQSLDKWMEEVQKFLTAEDVSWGDADVLEAQLEQSNALQDDVKTLEPILRNVIRVISLLSPKADEQLSQELKKINERLSTTWVTVVADSTQKNAVLKNALDLTKRTLEGITTTNQWLDELQTDIPEPAVINSTSELSQTLRKLNALKNRVDAKAIEYKSIVDAGNVVVSHSNVNAEMKNTFDSLTLRWNKSAGGVLERQKALKAASHHYGEFKVLTAQECDWQDKLEKKLTRSTTLAADAEEISEELDDLENYMKNRPKARLPRIESMGNELVSLNIMAEEVGSEVRQLTGRWSSLEEKTKAKAEWLENRVRGAQQCEQRLIQLHNAIMSIDAELNASLEQDLYGDELPELGQRLGQDITQQETLLSEIRHEEEDYEAEGRTEAAHRLHEQLSLIEAALQEVKSKYRKFQNPSELEPRLERMFRVLRDLEQSMCYIELASDDCEAIEGQLNNCIRFYTSLSEIKAEVEAVLREGRQQVEDGLVDDQATVSTELDSMKALYNRLGEQVAVARETLERALQLSYELNLELNNMNDSLNLLVTEIQKTEGTFSDNENTEEEIGFYQKCLNEMTDNQPKMDGIRANYEAFCGLCDVTLLETLRERVDEIAQEWQSIETRLRNKIASPNDESAGEDGDADDEEPSEPRSEKGADGYEQGLGEQGAKHHGSGEIPVRMYRSVVLTSVRQFTDPESQMSEQASEQPPFVSEDDDLERIEDVEMEGVDAPRLDGAEERYESVDLEQPNGGTTQLRPFETFGYFNAAFEDFDEQEKEAEQVTARVRSNRRMEVVRGELDQFNEEEEEEMDTSSSSLQSLTSENTSSEASELGSVKYMALDDNASSSIPVLNEPYTVEVCSSQLPSPEKPSMEVLDLSRPPTPEEFPLDLEHKDAAPFASPEDSEVEDTPRSLAEPTDADEHRLAMEHIVMERLRVEEPPVGFQERTGSPVHANTPPPTPAAHGEVASFQHFFSPLPAIADEMVDDDASKSEMDDIALDEGEKSDETNQIVETSESLNEIQPDSNSRQATHDDKAFQTETELERSNANQTTIPEGQQSSPPPLPEPSSSHQETNAEAGSDQLIESEAADVEITEEASVKNEAADVVTKEEMTVVAPLRSSRKVSRDEGTQTEFCALTGRLHATKAVRQADELVSIIEPQYSVALQVDPAAQLPDEAGGEAEEVLSPEPLEQPEFDQSEETSEQVAVEPVDAMDVAKETQVTSEARPALAAQVSDGEVFVDQPQPVGEANEEEDSFYGSDKEVDGEVEFSQTESARSSTSSSSDSDVVPSKQTQEQFLHDQMSLSNAADEPCPFDNEIAGFEKDVTQMLGRIDDVTAKFSTSTTPDIDGAELELAALEPDVASLISRGDSLVLQVQKLDLERALRVNATTGQLRSARSALKNSSEVRRQRLAEQEVTLKECQQQTEQLQIWLANIAQTLDHVTRVRDPSQLQSLEEELNKRQSDIRQLTEATGKLQEQQLLEYQALIGSLTLRWHELQRQFLEYQAKEAAVAVGSSAATELPTDNIMGGPDFVARVNKLREAIASVSRQMHSPPLNLKHYEQMSGQEDSIKAVKTALYTLKCDIDTYNRSKDEAVELAEATEQKEQIQRVLGKMQEEWTLLNKTYSDKQARVNQSLATWRTLHSDMKDFEEWIGHAETALAVLQAEGLNRAERKEKLKELESQVTARHKVMSNVTSTCREVGAECSTADAVLLREKQDTLGKRWRALLAGLAAVRQRLTSLDGTNPVPVSKLTPLVLSTPPRKADETQGSESDLTGNAKETPPTTPSTIVASLDKSILQIRDWLTVLETMLKQQVAIVGDADDVHQLLEKQKNVLRELEQKKPQLDELVQTAESIKDSGTTAAPSTPLVAGKSAQVSKLREHWEETAVAVTSRRNQLEELLGDSHQFERRRQDIDQWLARMENRLSKLAPIAATADKIDSQHREQKVLHSEIQQYKVQVDQLTQLTDRLVASYPHDDTRRAVRTNDNIAQRYSALDAGVNARGRALSAAMGSLHSFDRALDKFMAWLSDAESSLESLELELESYGPGVKTSRERVLMQLKELSVELDERRDEQAGLAASGQRLINSLTDGHLSSAGGNGGDDALMLRRRLDDMNRRWHGLRAKTVAIRNRLENNTEHWSALLLSLRELIEWVIRKDTELTGLGPIRGDLSALIKQQDDFRAFRRQLDDKRPLIEQSILTGRQLVANETPLSDASDSEANREFVPGDSRGYRSAEEAARELTHGIRREGTKLADRWAALRDRTERWSSDLDATTSRMQQLQASMDDASNRLAPAEAARAKWISPADLSQQQVQQQMDQLKELSDKIAPLQLAIEEVNDQAARLADSGVPLSHANLAKLDDLNSRWKVLQSSMDDRYQQLCGVTRDGALNGTLLQSFLSSSVERPWERSITEADVPYYVNHQTETTQWDHPQFEDLMNSLSEYNDVRFSAYRMALKLRRVQKFLCLDKLELSTAIDTFDAHGLRAQNDKVIDIPDMVTVLRSLYEVVLASYPNEVRLPLIIDLCLNWILNVYDSQRSGEIRVLSFKVIITLMCRGHLEEKYRYLFRLIADPNRLVDAPKLGVLLHDCVQLPRELGEVAAFGGSNIEPSVNSCFEKAGKQRQTIEAVHFLAWMKREPQSVVWLPVLHRLAASESARHQAKCNVCKTSPIIGLRYRCLKCLSFDMCQNCFFTGKIAKHHKLTHPMQEYCTTTTSGEDLKDFTRTLRNKFKSKRYFKKHPRLGYLPVQTALEGTATPSDMQSENSSLMPPSTLAGQEIIVHSTSVSVNDGIHKEFTPESEDEHQLIAQYCRSLNGEPGSNSGTVPRSPVQLLASLNSNHKEEIETMIRELEEENATLQAEYERLRSQQSPSMSFSFSSSPDDATPVPHHHLANTSGSLGAGLGTPTTGTLSSDVERDMLAEARLLRQHKTRLEARMKILEEHNRQLETQLSRLRQLLDEPSGNTLSPARTGTLQTRAVTAAHLATDTPVRTNGISHDSGHSWTEHNAVDRLETRPPPPPLGSSYGQPSVPNTQNVGNLLFMAGDLGRAVGSLVNVMTDADDHSQTDEEN